MIILAKLKSMWTTIGYRALLGVGLVWALGLGFADIASAQGTTCDPTRASCVPGGGRGGIGGGSCTPLQQALGQCTPGVGGGGIGGSSGGASRCTASPGGNPSCGGGAATTASAGPSSGAGNPINLLNGNKYQEETDLAALPGVLGLELKRYYNSQSSHPGLIGAHWRMSYETVLYDFGGEIQILQADGRRLMFQRGTGQNIALCSSPQPLDGQVRIEAAEDGRGPPTYHWRWADGRTLSFSGGSGGGFPLQAITAATGERVTLAYSPSGELTGIRDPQGRKLVFIYASAAEAAAQKRSRALKAIDTPLGRLTYQQDNLGRLTEVGQAKDATSARFVSRLYHYEDRYNAGHKASLTGISIKGIDPQTHQSVEQRLSTYAYNAQGQAILSTKGRPREIKDGQPVPDTGIEQVEVQYLDKPLPYDVKIDRQSGEATATHFGKVVLTNSLGQQTRVTSAVIGGHFRLIEMRGPGCSTCGPSDMRYAYDRAGLLLRSTQLDREGKPILNQITRLDKYGRTARVGIQTYTNDKAQPSQWIERYEYADVTYPDGSIAVAPQPSLIAKPSVVTGKEHTLAMRYNAQGQITQVTEAGFSPVDEVGHANIAGAPISRSTRLAYQVVNARSVLSAIDGPLPNGPKDLPEDSDISRYDWGRNGDFVALLTAPGNQRIATDRDEVGRVKRHANHAPALGPVPANPDNLEQRWWLASGADQPQAPQTEPNANTSSEAGSDASMLPVAFTGSTAFKFLQILRGAPGTAAQGHVTGLQTRSAAAHRLFDDFARVVAIENPGQSVQTAVYDQADHLVLVIDPRGARQVMTWNVAGRLMALQRFMPGSSVVQQSLQWNYAGSWVAEEIITDADGTRRTLTERDAQGRVTKEQQRIEPAERLQQTISTAITLTQSFRYDGQGRMTESTLTDNPSASLTLASTFTAQGEPVTLSQRGWLPSWLGGRQAIVEQIDWQQIAGYQYATAITHANGIVDHFDRLELDPPRTSANGEPTQPMEAALPMSFATEASNSSNPGRDAAGLPASVTTTQGKQRLTWNAAGQLASAESAQGRDTYLYDARGRRVLKITVDAQQRTNATVSQYRGVQLAAEADARGSATYAYVHLGWHPVAQVVLQTEDLWGRIVKWLLGAEVRQLHTDRAGKALRMTGGRGQVMWQAQDTIPNAVHQPLRYVGQYHDDSSGLDYHGARYYEAMSGRFISPDPAGVSDSVNEVAAPLLLDLYAYAAGRPDDYFDPDGAARIRYFAITTGANGQALGATQGFTKTRWAFIVDNLQGGIGSGGNNTLGTLRNEYAASSKAMLYDGNGNFLAAAQTTKIWDGAGDSTAQDFTAHYGNNLISISQFKINDVSDDDATNLIASYIPADWNRLYGGGACPVRSALLPEIKFAAEEPTLDPTVTDPARLQRIVACGADSDASLEQRRTAKYELAAELNETGGPKRINKDCSADGCPGVHYSCNATECVARTSAPAGVSYVASYGPSQFIGATMVDQLTSNYAAFTPEQKETLGLGPTSLQDLRAASTRGTKTVTWFNGIAGLPAANYANAATAWDNLPAATKAQFTAETGLGEQAYEDMVRVKTKPPKNSNGTNLQGDALQGFVTDAIMSTPAIKTLLMGINKGFDKFTIITQLLIHKNLNTVLARYPSASEEEIAARVARLHNGGRPGGWRLPLVDLIGREDPNNYVKRFLGNQHGEGEWRSLRCTQDFGSTVQAVAPGTDGKGIGGLQFTALQLR